MIHYELPIDRKGNLDYFVYLQRTDFTGYSGRMGVSVIFVHNGDTYRQRKSLEKHFRMTTVRVPTRDWEDFLIIYLKISLFGHAMVKVFLSFTHYFLMISNSCFTLVVVDKFYNSS